MKSLLCIALLLPGVASAEERVSFERYTWSLHDQGGRVLPYLDRPSLYLERGIATVDAANFADGTVEFDVALHAVPSFAGVIFRTQGPEDYEAIYVRPQRSRQPDAVQYTPVFAGDEAWQLYVGEGYTAAAELPVGRWMHVKVVVAGLTARVFLDNAVQPQLTVTDLKRPWARGGVGLFGRYGANFSYVSITASGGTSAPPAPEVQVDSGVIGRWRISQVWDAAAIPADRLPDDRASRVEWESVATERSGLLNLARYRHRVADETRPRNSDGRDVVLAKAVLVTTRAQRVRLTFGYSDDVTVFLNGAPLFAGRARYLLRDSAYLGTLTLGSDAVYLDLLEGRNELVFAVAELFGGWGLAAKIDSQTGVRIE